MSVLHMIPYDRDEPAAWELQVITEKAGKKTKHQVQLIC